MWDNPKVLFNRVQPVWLKRGQGCKPSCSKEVS
jgi:hypothetical protein